MEFVNLLIGGLVGALLALGTKWLEEWRDRRRRRQALATALLVELRSLELGLRSIAQTTQPDKAFGPIAFFFDRARTGALADLSLFGGQTVYEVMKFGGYVRSCQVAHERLKEPGASDSQLSSDVCTLASYAACRVPLVRGALLKEGAVEHTDSLPEFARLPKMPVLPPPSFPNAS